MFIFLTGVCWSMNRITAMFQPVLGWPCPRPNVPSIMKTTGLSSFLIGWLLHGITLRLKKTMEVHHTYHINVIIDTETHFNHAKVFDLNHLFTWLPETFYQNLRFIIKYWGVRKELDISSIPIPTLQLFASLNDH